jgi:hypothetical protein
MGSTRHIGGRIATQDLFHGSLLDLQKGALPIPRPWFRHLPPARVGRGAFEVISSGGRLSKMMPALDFVEETPKRGVSAILETREVWSLKAA